MEIVSSQTFNVMDGEPQLGKQIEAVIRVDRDEYIEALVDAFMNGCDSVGDEFEIEDRELDIIQTYQLGCDLTQGDIDEINRQIDEHLLDDDYGTQKAWDFMYDLIDSYIDDNWLDEFETVTMRGY